ncbi:GTP-binding protein [Hyphomicrobium sp. CS1BSMeth3]|uniref:GTP-binding protein n=1 Tax=Hyphomicrobium sp. CS1BSMeth3 TaxID=1892844 RepID=UPI0009307F81
MTAVDIPVTILGGYLGAGKTTLINHVLSHALDVRVAVLVNDFGAVNIDASLISSRAEDTITLSNGCVCCTIQDDLGAAIDAQLRRDKPPQHILIEASGVAEPARMLRYVESWPGLSRHAVVCVVDVETIRERATDKFVGGVVRRQIGSADLLILNKTDLVDAEARSSVVDWLSGLASGAGIVESTWGRIDPALVLQGAHQAAASRYGELAHARPGTFFNATVPMEEALDLDELETVLGDLPASVHRVKGFVTDIATGRTMLVQCVAARRSIEPCPHAADAAPQALMAIGTDRKDLEALRLQLAALGAGNEAALNDPIRSGTRSARRAAVADGGAR